MTSIIFKRTSIRSYTEQQPTDEQITTLLHAGMAAPSAKNTQPWEFVVVKEKNTLNKIRDFHLYASMLDQAPLAIVVCGNKENVAVDANDLWPQDCAAATENILLEATELGLGGVWLGCYPSVSYIKKLQNILELPDNVIPFAIVSLGYPAGDTHPKDKFDKTKIHYEKWGTNE